jgi:NhaP-type Na+/H+ or K+/H+ antiporter
MLSLAIAAALVLAYGAASRRLADSMVTGPMVFVAGGLALGDAGLGVLDLNVDEEGVRILTEATLVLVLFVDATEIRLPRLVREVQLPGRMLTVGLLGSVALGTGVALLLFDLRVFEAALLAAVLAPTDAALGQAVITNRTVPARIRETLSVESGLNDGLALPMVTLFLGLAVGAESADVSGPGIARFVSEQLGYGALVGVALGLVGGRVIDWAVTHDWITGLFQQLSTLAVPVCAFAVADLAGGNGFIAAFVAGLAFGQVAREHCAHASDFAEDEGQLLSLLTFLVFGAALAGPALGDAVQPQTVLYAVLSLTVVRMLPVAVSLLGTGLTVPTVGFLGWFGPRGLASILFAVLVLEEGELAVQAEILTIVSWTVLLSVFAHGMSAEPLAAAYGRHVEPMGDERAEMRAQPAMRGGATGTVEADPPADDGDQSG